MKNQEYNLFVQSLQRRLKHFYTNMVSSGQLEMDNGNRLVLAEVARKEYEELLAEINYLIEVDNSGKTWTQCDSCGVWRRMPDNYSFDGRWTCEHEDHK
eukprot:scaffold306249_cov52-Prasinocladus_malaysianus.AAC.1